MGVEAEVCISDEDWDPEREFGPPGSGNVGDDAITLRTLAERRPRRKY